MKLIDAITYLCSKYPYKDELSNARVTKMIYLADWRHALDKKVPLTNITWEFNHFGPWVPDVLNEARAHPESIELVPGRTAFGSDKVCFEARSDARWDSLTVEELTYLDQVVESTKQLTFQGFIDLVYGTFPVRRSKRYDTLDLAAFAAQYWREQADA